MISQHYPLLTRYSDGTRPVSTDLPALSRARFEYGREPRETSGAAEVVQFTTRLITRLRTTDAGSLRHIA